MKRDMDLIRKILLAIEASPDGRAPPVLDFEGYTGEEIGYHCLLLVEAGLVDGVSTITRQDPTPAAVVTRLTWHGHEFLDAAKDPTAWDTAKAVAKASGGIAFEVLKTVLVKYGVEQAGRAMGLTP